MNNCSLNTRNSKLFGHKLTDILSNSEKYLPILKKNSLENLIIPYNVFINKNDITHNAILYNHCKECIDDETYSILIELVSSDNITKKSSNQKKKTKKKEQKKRKKTRKL
uniref:Uncharacterized protein n=1 Tax=viral metagenome TaxID=1070528 RepID=A0A6C0AZN7_9ZZZZ|tara:strand:+ start:6574 stop:6903 length:330 start_codon:yes stop_codon:yes gene_type:complete